MDARPRAASCHRANEADNGGFFCFSGTGAEVVLGDAGEKKRVLCAFGSYVEVGFDRLAEKMIKKALVSFIIGNENFFVYGKWSRGCEKRYS